MEKVIVKLVLENGVELPKYMTEGAAGMDVKANISEAVVLKTLERKLIPTGIKMEIPYGYEVQVRPDRKSTRLNSSHRSFTRMPSSA